MIERPKANRNYRSSLLGKSNLPGLCFTWETGVIRSSSAEAGARAAAEGHRPLGKSSILNPTETR
jgi:hypothetical protein